MCVFFSHLNSIELPGLCVNHQEVPMQLSRQVQVVHISPLEGTSCVFGGHGGYLRIKLEITMFWCSLVSCLVLRYLSNSSLDTSWCLSSSFAGQDVAAVCLHLQTELKWAVGILQKFWTFSDAFWPGPFWSLIFPVRTAISVLGLHYVMSLHCKGRGIRIALLM